VSESESVPEQTSTGDPEGLTDTHKILAWLFLIGFVIVTKAARGIYSSQGIEPSGRFVLLELAGLVTFQAYWLRSQCRPYRIAFPLDIAFFLPGLWFGIFPYYLWRCERWRGVGKCLGVAGGHVLGYISSVLVYYLLVSGRQ
jgi:hypothetical protein